MICHHHPVSLGATVKWLLRFEVLDSMQQDSSNRGRYSDPSASILTPLRGDFRDISPGFESRARSLSPRKRLVKQPLHIRMNLTESQVDKITDAYVICFYLSLFLTNNSEVSVIKSIRAQRRLLSSRKSLR